MHDEKIKMELSEDQAQFVLNAVQKYTDDSRHSWPDHFVAFAESIITLAKTAMQQHS